MSKNKRFVPTSPLVIFIFFRPDILQMPVRSQFAHPLCESFKRTTTTIMTSTTTKATITIAANAANSSVFPLKSF